MGDAEHVVALEANDPLELVRCMEAMRKPRVRIYTRSDLPIYLGRRQRQDELFAELL